MKAKEMFEALGYIERPETTSMCCVKSYTRRDEFICDKEGGSNE